MNRKRFIMAIDPFEEDLRPSREALDWINPWLQRENASLDVVYVLNCADKGGSLFDSCTIAEQQLRQTVSNFDLGVPVNPYLIVEESNSTRNAVQAVIQYAHHVSAETILLTSYGRNLVGRLVLGSFADRLLALSPIPVLFLNQSRHPSGQPDRVLFPTDFSPASRCAFNLFLENAKGNPIEVVLLHVLTSMAAIYDYTLIDSTISFPDNYFEDLRRFVVEESANWTQHAERMGFPVRFILEIKNNDVAETVMRFARSEKIDLIALASSKAQVPARVLGSVASSLFYQRILPIWICGPEAIRREFGRMENQDFNAA